MILGRLFMQVRNSFPISWCMVQRRPEDTRHTLWTSRKTSPLWQQCQRVVGGRAYSRSQNAREAILHVLVAAFQQPESGRVGSCSQVRAQLLVKSSTLGSVPGIDQCHPTMVLEMKRLSPLNSCEPLGTRCEPPRLESLPPPVRNELSGCSNQT